MNRVTIFKLVLTICLLWFSIHQVIIIEDGLTDENLKHRFAVVFGTTVHEDGTLSERLKARLVKGVKLYKDSTVSDVYVSGGFGKEGFYEGEKMAEFLIQEGIPDSHIYIDNEGKNTRLTALSFINDFPDVKSVVVVTQFFHVTRAKLAFEQLNLKNVTGAHPKYYENRDVYSLFREFFGYYKYLICY